MSNPREKYGIDRNAESVVEIDDMQFVIRAATGNRAFTYATAIAGGKRRDDLNAGGERGIDALEDVLIEAFPETVIVGWRNVDGPDGQPLPFTRENCMSLMQDCPAIWEELKEAARDDSRFRTAPIKEDGDALGKS